MTGDVRNLLGGYATGTLTEEEKKLLFDAALRDDEVFAALANEQALREMLEDSAARTRLLQATEEPRFSVSGAFREWFARPKAKALVGTGAVLLAVSAFNSVRDAQKPSEPDQMAQVRAPATEQPPTPAPNAPPPAKPAAKAKSKPDPRPPIVKDAKPLAERLEVAPPQASGVTSNFVAGGRLARQIAPAALPLSYELLRREADGVFRPVLADQEFQAADLVRVRVTASQRGAVAISPPNQGTFATNIAPNESAVLPASGGIALGSDMNNLVLSFVPAVDSQSQPVTINIPIRRSP